MWLWKRAECDLRQRAEGAHGAAEQFRQIEAGDVLHHFPAAFVGFTEAVHRPEAKQVIAAAAITYRGRAVAICGKHATDRGEIGWPAEQRSPIGGLETEPQFFLR